MSGKRGKSGRKASGARALAFAPEVPKPPAAVGPVPASVVDTLQAPGRAFVTGMWLRYEDWEPASLALLHQAGGVVDSLHEYREVLAAEGRTVTGPRGGTLLHPLVRVEAQAIRSLMLLVTALGLET